MSSAQIAAELLEDAGQGQRTVYERTVYDERMAIMRGYGYALLAIAEEIRDLRIALRSPT